MKESAASEIFLVTFYFTGVNLGCKINISYVLSRTHVSGAVWRPLLLF